MILAEPGALVQLTGLFAAAFGAATILPLQSEVVFVGLQLAGTAPVSWLIVVASIGNTLGAGINYVMGRGIARFRSRRWFPVGADRLAQAERWYARWGVWTLLLSWAPLGDAFTVIAGTLRTPVWLFLILVSIAKTGRYVALAWMTARVAG